jgi:hypothetical protein
MWFIMAINPFNPRSFMIGISNYRRPKQLWQTLVDWVNSTPSYVPILILSNTSIDNDITISTINDVRKAYPDREFIHVVDYTRHVDHWGCLAQSYNTIIQHILKHHEWVILSQDDVNIASDWMDIITNAPPRYYYNANVGDQISMFGRQLFNLMPYRGWYDERYRLVGVHDVDFVRRVIRRVGMENVCIESVTEGFINPIGLYTRWRMANQHGGSDLFHQRQKSQKLRGTLPLDCNHNIIGIDHDRFEDGANNPQMAAVVKPPYDSRPYADVALQFYENKFDGWGISGYKHGVKQENLERLYLDHSNLTEGQQAVLDAVPADYKKYYNNPKLVQDKKSGLLYVEGDGCGRCWFEGEQKIPDIDWAPWFVPGELKSYG